MSFDETLLPRIGPEDAPFWAAAREHEFRMQRCDDCGHIRWPPGPVCPKCWAREAEWVRLSGRGVVNTWVVFHRAYFEAFADRVPYSVVEVELAEGPRYLANLLECENDEISRGMPVEVVFEDVTAEVTLPQFRPRM
jgi:uncharacterized OB-fold protein